MDRGVPREKCLSAARCRRATRSTCWHRCPMRVRRWRFSIRNSGQCSTSSRTATKAPNKKRVSICRRCARYIDACLRRIALALRPSGYCMLWADTFNLCEGHHRRVKMPLSASTVSLGTIFVPATAIEDGARATICWCYRKNHYVQRLHGATTASDVAGMRRSTRSFTHIHTPSRSV